MGLVGSILFAGCLAGFAWALLDILLSPRTVDSQLGRFEEERREVLRERSFAYRWFEPWIDESAPINARIQAKRLPHITDDLIGSGEPVFPAGWKAEEFLATKQVEALTPGFIGAFFGYVLGGLGAAFFLGAAFLGIYAYFTTWDLASRSKKRRQIIRRRMASSIELMSLMMEVGATFQDALTAVAEEAGDHPLGIEFRALLRDLSLGSSRPKTLTNFAERMGDEDSRDLMAAILQGEKLGTPIAETLKTQAVELRMKRSQWAEKAAEESKVALVFPAMLIMGACLAIVVTPFILSAVYAPPG